MAKKIHNMNELISDVRKRLAKNDKALLDDMKLSGIDYAPASKQDLKHAAEALQGYLQKWIRNYFDNYSPKVYGRDNPSAHERNTRNFEESVSVEIVSNNGNMTARVYFDNSSAYRDSLWGGSQAYLPAILNDGYRVKSGYHKDIHHFGYFEGARFMEAAVIEAKKDFKFKNIEIIMNTDNPW